MDKLKPEYNILTTAGSSFGFKHSQETLAKLRGRKLSDETRGFMKQRAIGRHIGLNTLKRLWLKWVNTSSKKGKNNPLFGTHHSEETKAILSEANGIAIKVFDKETNVTSNYTSMRKAAEGIGVVTSTLFYHFKKSNCFCLKGRYQIEKVQID